MLKEEDEVLKPDDTAHLRLEWGSLYIKKRNLQDEFEIEFFSFHHKSPSKSLVLKLKTTDTVDSVLKKLSTEYSCEPGHIHLIRNGYELHYPNWDASIAQAHLPSPTGKTRLLVVVNERKYCPFSMWPFFHSFLLSLSLSLSLLFFFSPYLVYTASTSHTYTHFFRVWSPSPIQRSSLT